MNSEYYVGRIVLDCINECDLNFNKGNVVKYVCRAGKKPKESEYDDLMKAKDYLIDEINKHLPIGRFYLAYADGEDNDDDQRSRLSDHA